MKVITEKQVMIFISEVTKICEAYTHEDILKFFNDCLLILYHNYVITSYLNLVILLESNGKHTP